MPQLVKLGSHSSDTWRTFDVEDVPENAADIPEDSLLPLASYLALADTLTSKHGVWLASDDDVEQLGPYLAKLPVIACRVTNFMDGRNFSQARILRDQLEYTGAIRAIGGFIQDQLFYLLRCGFTEFSVDNDADFESLQQSLNDFSESYQAACDTKQPLFRRRA